MTRKPETLVAQARDFLRIIGAAQSLKMILDIDPLFKKFMTEECGVNEKLVSDLEIVAIKLAIGLANDNGVVTVENCNNFLDNNRE